MEDIMADIRRAVTDEQAGKMALRTTETRQATGGNPGAGLLSREATAAVGSAFSTLTETVRSTSRRWKMWFAKRFAPC